jgi:programmed cell death protein 5
MGGGRQYLDDELELLKKRKMLEIQRRMIAAQEKKTKDRKEPPEPTNKEILDRYFVGRAREVYDAARSQFPSIFPQVEEMIVTAIKSGKVTQKIDGENLYHLFRQLGYRLRLNTRIRISEHGELKTLEQKMKENK